MLVSPCLSVNGDGHLAIGGVDTVSIAQQYGTPLYVMDENLIVSHMRIFKDSMNENYSRDKGIVAYASKAFSCKEIYRICEREGLWIDVVSIGELYTALSAGFPVEHIYFHGNNKTVAELEYAVDMGVGRIVVDNTTELQTLANIAKKADRTVAIMFRIKPGIDAHTHDFVKTGRIDSKFGLALETGEALEAVKAAFALDSVELKGIHCHIGSQIFDIDPFEHAAAVMMDFIAAIKRETGRELGELNLGGGFGIMYTDEDDPKPYESYMGRVSAMIKQKAQEHGLELPVVTIEPGRSIVGPTGITLYTAGAVKDIPGVRTYVSVDGGMGDNPRYILYQSRYTAVVANKASQPADARVTIAGRCCESGDLIGEDMPIQPVEPGDIIAVLATGAYNYAMASNYNRIPRPAIVFVKDGQTRVVVRAESVDDIIRNDV